MDLITIGLNLATLVVLILFLFYDQIEKILKSKKPVKKVEGDVIYYDSHKDRFTDPEVIEDVSASDVFFEALKDPNNRIRTDYNEELKGPIGDFDGYHWANMKSKQI